MQSNTSSAPDLDFSRNHFDLFGLPTAYTLDTAALDLAYRNIQAQIHPDKFAHAGEAEQRLSMQWATRINEAYQTLKKPFDRALYLLKLQGIDAMDPTNTAMPPAFLMQQMEWRESLGDALSSRNMAGLQALERTLREEARALQTYLGTLLDTQQDYPAAGETLRKLRFMDKLIIEIDSAFEALE